MERTTYMQRIMNETYPGIALEAIKEGFENAWERLIARRLMEDYNNKHSEAEVIIDSLEGGYCFDNFRIAAKMITSSKIPEHATN